MTDDEWYRTVYRPKEAQFTVRAVIFGCAIGSVLSAANLYTGMTIGWTYGTSITAAIFAWVAFKGWSAVSGARHFTVLENNTMQTAASAAGAMAGAGLVNAIPALMVLTGKQLTFVQTAAWLASVAFLGICFAVPLKRQFINVEDLKFPSGIAAAEATRALHGEGAGGVQKAIALFGASGFAALITFLKDKLELFPATLPVVGPKLRGYAIGKLTLGVEPDMLLLGAGALIGLRTCMWMAIGATVCWVGFMPWVADADPPLLKLNFDAPKFFGAGGGHKWLMWPGVTVLVVSGILGFAFKIPSLVRAFGSLKAIKAGMTRTAGTIVDEGPESVEVPMRWLAVALPLAALVCIATQYWVFEMAPWLTAIAIVVSALMAIVACRAQGETDVNPIGGMGKVTQLLFAVLAPGNSQANLMAAGITAAGANNSGDLLQDMKTGRLLGASPRKQFIAQMFGIVSGAAFTVFVFVKAFPIESIGTKYPAPAVQTWKGMAEILTKGLSNLPTHTPTAIAVAAALAVALTVATELAGPGVKKWLPSPTALGLSFILPASNSYTFLAGAVIATLVARKSPKTDETYTVAVASGLVAGASIMGVGVAVWTAMQASGGGH